MTNTTPSPGNDTGLSDAQRRAPITQDDLMTLNGLALAIELCSDVIDGLIDPGTAKGAGCLAPSWRQASPSHRADLERADMAAGKK